jgi:hypothetical protein
MANITEFEKHCYGMSTEGIRREYMESLTARVSGLEMVVMGILSDCQELQEMAGSFPDGQADNTIRQYLNRAKFILSEMMEAQKTA